MEFQQDWQKDKEITALSIFLAQNLEKFRSTEHYGAPLEGSTIFLYRSYVGHMSPKSRRFAEWKYAIFSRAGRKTKNLPRSKLFLLMALSMGS